MIGFRPYGRAGNFFFMAANAAAYAIKHNQQFSTPKATNDNFWNPIYLSHLQHPTYQQGREDVLINEPHFHYAPPIEFQPEWADKHVIFNGYYQSELFIKDYRSEILYLFDLPYELKPVISLHARYGDYLTIIGKHILVDEEYILKAIALMKERTGIERVKVFSDDLPLFKQRHGHLHDFEYSTNTNEIDDLVEMSCCAHNVNSSSTFAWWGSWLNRNPDKVVITQSKWFGDSWNLDWKDVIPSTWIKL